MSRSAHWHQTSNKRGGRPLWSRTARTVHVPNADNSWPSQSGRSQFHVQGSGGRHRGSAFKSGPRSFDITPEGRIVGIGSAGQNQSASAPAQINVVLNWFEELKARVPTK